MSGAAVEVTAVAPPVGPKPEPDQTWNWNFLPLHLRPGHLVTMQPVDAVHDRQWYIEHSAYCGQPKRDGMRFVAFATSETIAFQSRSGQTKPPPCKAMADTLKVVAQEIGPFVLDGELWWPDCNGGEHRTGAQAAEANRQIGNPTAPVNPVLAVFEALWTQSRGDMTNRTFDGRFLAGNMVVERLRANCGCEMFEFLEPAITESAKAVLSERQHAEGREGEVWRLRSSEYVGGKMTSGRDWRLEPIVKTKYETEHVLRVTGFTTTGATKVARRFAAIKVADAKTGADMGLVGTGFTQADQDALVEAFAEAQASGRPLLIEVTSKGRTEYGALWHPVYKGIYENGDAA